MSCRRSAWLTALVFTTYLFAWALAACAQHTESPILTFTGGSGGANPGGLISDSHGNLYGVAAGGGNNPDCAIDSSPGCGLVYELSSPNGGSGPWTETVIYAFSRRKQRNWPFGLDFRFARQPIWNGQHLCKRRTLGGCF
jgi:hypothetical protein